LLLVVVLVECGGDIGRELVRETAERLADGVADGCVVETREVARF